jgi:hypothetical protein
MIARARDDEAGRAPAADDVREVDGTVVDRAIRREQTVPNQHPDARKIIILLPQIFAHVVRVEITVRI